MAIENASADMSCCCPAAFFLLLGLVLAGEGMRQYLLVQKIRNTPTSKVRSAAVGLVEFCGHAHSAEKLISPITKKPCAYHEVVAQYYYRTKNSSGWRTFYHPTSGNRFYLEDDTGKMLVDPKDAEISMAPDFSFRGHLSDKAFFGLIPQQQLDGQVLAYLDENPAAKTAFQSQGSRDIRVVEYFIGEKDPVYVLGSAEPLEGAGSAIAHENLIVRKNKTDKIMYLSDSSETKVAGSMGLTSWVYIILGFGFAALSLIAIIGSMGALV